MLNHQFYMMFKNFMQITSSLIKSTVLYQDTTTKPLATCIKYYDCLSVEVEIYSNSKISVRSNDLNQLTCFKQISENAF